MRNPICPFCKRPVARYRVQPLQPGTINPGGYDINCEYCFYKSGGQDYLKFFGTCYLDMEFKYFVLRTSLQSGSGVLMIEVMRDSYLIKTTSPNGDGSLIIEEKHDSLTPDAACHCLLRVLKLMAFT